MVTFSVLIVGFFWACPLPTKILPAPISLCLSQLCYYNVVRNDLDCLWELSVETTGYLRLVIYDFDLEEKREGHCIYDYVDLYESDVFLER